MADLAEVIGSRELAAISYTLISVMLGWLCIHFRWLRWTLMGVFIHMLGVSTRMTLRVLYPISDTLDWPSAHRFTALIGACCAIYFFVQWRKGKV